MARAPETPETSGRERMVHAQTYVQMIPYSLSISLSQEHTYRVQTMEEIALSIVPTLPL
jgi:hypothetical protein